MPPFCISTHDVDFLVTTLTKILAEIEIENSTIIFDELFTPEPSTYVPLNFKILIFLNYSWNGNANLFLFLWSRSSASRLEMTIPGNTYHMEELQSSPEPPYEYSFSDEEARREAEAYADMD